ncbi:MAG TPA: hypothetical protein PK079_18815 [Leptospiraceae bacterium]|nr:hypothetical protein [Leptospiraceae bacterium]HMX31099.1 hypothetical protein [Leptospiraceae bacterium]HMY31915.1 hypothetical protein [Leptospiraceae bacterium]HMZ65386.1 hypothetical protein [Leptospiraceae bacterium]HNA06270.1 hypothetical protein [Leptospiraceae bacterium]
MKKYLFLFLILLVFACRSKKARTIWDFPTKPNTDSVYFTYGTKAGSNTDVNPNQLPSWGPSLKITDQSICLESQDDFFKSKEYGPSLGLCLEPREDNKDLLTTAIATLNELDESKIRPDGYLIQEEQKIHLYYQTITEIVNEISSSGSRTLFLGDSRLHNALSKRLDFSIENYKSVSGDREHRIETSFSLPYFSIFVLDKTVKIAFPPLESTTPRSQYHYLVLDVTNLVDLVSLIESNFTRIQATNDTWRASCSREKLEITEVMGYASGVTKRFIEWSSNSENPICLDTLQLSISGKKVTIDSNSTFLFPKAVKLFVEESSPLQGIVLNADWREIKGSAAIELISYDLKDNWNLPENVNFNWAEEEFSIKKRGNSCEWANSVLHNSKLCGDPGIEFDENTVIPGTNVGVNHCKPEDFILTELNATGLKPENRMDRTGKFLEVKYLGGVSCKLTGLFLNIGSIKVPLTMQALSLEPNSIWLVTDGRHVTGVKNLIRRNLDFLQWQHSISLQSSSSTKLLWKGLKAEEYFLNESSNGNLFSMVVDGESFYHHPVQKPNLLQAVYRQFHSMSPGEANERVLQDAEGHISEVLWAGGYKNSSSILDEKFIELKTKGDGTLEVEVSLGNKNYRYFIPISRNDAFTVLAKSNLQCFPDAKELVSDKLILSDEVTTIRLKSDGKIINEVKYFPSRGNGFNNTSQKIRASYAYTGLASIWKTSSQPLRVSIASDCIGQTFATPNAPNEFEPFLSEENFDYQGSGKFYLAASMWDINLPYSVKLYSKFPEEEAIIGLEKLSSNLLKQIPNLLNSIGLIYQKLENYSDLKIYNRDGIFIEGVMVNPSNPQNEWVLFCNRSKSIKDLTEYEIEDEDSFDQIDTYFKRKKFNLPSGLNSSLFSGNTSVLQPGQCGYLVDPESSLLNLKPVGVSPTLIYTVRTTSTIGNGISSGEYLDLYKVQGGNRFHIHSFGNRYSHSPFTIPVITDEIILLQSNKRGEDRYDYEVVKW